MATVRDIVQRAFRLIGVVAHDDAMSADQGAAGLAAFNDMLHAWTLDGITLSPAFTDAALNDAFPLADAYREGCAFILAGRLSPEFMAPAAFDADDFFRKVQASYCTVTESTIDEALTWVGSTLRGVSLP